MTGTDSVNPLDSLRPVGGLLLHRLTVCGCGQGLVGGVQPPGQFHVRSRYPGRGTGQDRAVIGNLDGGDVGGGGSVDGTAQSPGNQSAGTVRPVQVLTGLCPQFPRVYSVGRGVTDRVFDRFPTVGVSLDPRCNGHGQRVDQGRCHRVGVHGGGPGDSLPVQGGDPLRVSRRVLLCAQFVDRRQLGVIVVDNAVQDVFGTGGVLVTGVVDVTVLSVGVQGGGHINVESVLCLASGHSDVEAVAVEFRVDETVGRVHGRALGPVDGGGVAELGVGGYVVRRQCDLALRLGVEAVQRPVGGDLPDGEKLTVEHPCTGVTLVLLQS